MASARQLRRELERLRDAVVVEKIGSNILIVPFHAEDLASIDYESKVAKAKKSIPDSKLIVAPPQMDIEEWARAATAYCADLMSRVDEEFHDV